ncbi:MAG: class 1 fructose-bisphosphatase, partial [Bryobacteraceae bacterium]
MIVTVQQHILQQQEELFPGARGNFSSLLSGLTLATKMIQAKIRRAGLVDIIGSAGETNVQGETQQKLDVYANQALLHILGGRESVAMLVSEENEQPMAIDLSENGKYVVVFDPLDGSSNIDVNVSVGTIFSIFRRPEGAHGAAAVLQPGSEQVAAGYVVYGSSSIFVYTAGQGVYGFTLEPDIGAYVLSYPNMRMPDRGPYYSVNEANAGSFPDRYRTYLGDLRSKQYGSRYIGSL